MIRRKIRTTLADDIAQQMLSHPPIAPEAPIFLQKEYVAPSIFTPENLLQGARRQKRLSHEGVPTICILDPDGDLVEYLRQTQRTQRHAGWACYHTHMDTFRHQEQEFGIVGRVVGSSFSVLVAEELFASGCELLISISSAGQLLPIAPPPYMVLVDRALRDEGTSYHYLPPSTYSYLHPALKKALCANWDYALAPLHCGTSWTTDAPFRETAQTLARYSAAGILTVEMEIAALYAMASARQREVVCFAMVTNKLGLSEQDFEKGLCEGSITALQVIDQAASIWQRHRRSADD